MKFSATGYESYSTAHDIGRIATIIFRKSQLVMTFQ